MHNSIETVMIVLKQMITSSQEILELLINDRQLLSKKDLNAIEISNQKKIVLIDQLNLSAQHFKNEKSLESFLHNLDSPDQGEIKTLISQLKTEITQCYKYIVSNTQF